MAMVKKINIIINFLDFINLVVNQRLLILVFCCLFAGCASTSKKSKKSVQDRRSGSEVTKSQDSASAESMTFSEMIVTSTSNINLTSQKIDEQSALDLSISLKSKQNPSEKDLIEAITAARVGKIDTTELLNYAHELMKVRIRKNQKDLPDNIKLEIGLAAIQDKNLPKARVFLDPLLKTTTHNNIKAAIYNAYGVAALQTKYYSTAAQEFKKALKIRPDYPPALFNLGFLSLKFGHYKTAQQHLSSMQDDWYAKTGLVTADRHTNKKSRVSAACQRLVQSKSRNKIVLFNCGLFYFQNLNNKQKARDLIEKATQEAGGDDDWDEIAFKVMELLQ